MTVSYIAQNNFIYFQLMNLQPDILPQYRQVTGNAAFQPDTDIKQRHASPVLIIDNNNIAFSTSKQSSALRL